MKAFEYFNDFGEVEYLDDCKRIWEYLEDHGTINFSKHQLVDYYHRFSECCYCAGWLIVNDNILENFAEWLSKQEL